MASELLKTFEKIEHSRKLLIEKIRSIGYNVPDNMPIHTAVNYINGPEERIEYHEGKDVHDWVRPPEWPDNYKILEDAKLEDIEGCKAGAIFMLDATATDTIDLPVRTKSYSQSSTTISLGASFVKTSDGQIIDLRTAATTLTWDHTKDIIVESGEYPGRYCYMILYYDPTFAFTTGTGMVTPMPIVEMIIDKLETTRDLSNASTCYHTGFAMKYSSGGTVSQYLISYHVLETSNLGNCYYNINSCYPIPYCPASSPLRYVNTGSITRFAFGYSNGNLYGISPGNYCTEIRFPNVVNTGLTYFYDSHRLKIFDAPKLVAPSNTFFVDKNTSKKIEIFNAPKCTKYSSIPYGGSLKYYDWDTLIDPLDGFIDLSPIPRYKFEGRTITSYATSISTLREIDLSFLDAGQFGYPVTSDATSLVTIGKSCRALRYIYIPDNFKSRLDLSTVELEPTNVEYIIDALADLTGLTVYNPYIKLSEFNQNRLTEEYKQKIIDKGWIMG